MNRDNDILQDWLKLFRTVGKEALERAKSLFGTEESREELGRGAGGDMTIRMDMEMEEILIGHLRQKDNVKLISEEAGELTFGAPEFVVVADPLDGSHNAGQGIPLFAISLALAAVPEPGADFVPRISDIELGYIMNLVSGDEYWAFVDGGAYKNDAELKRLHPSRFGNFAAELSPYPVEAFTRFAPILNKNSRVRCVGSLALDLCFTAEGIFDCMFDLRAGKCRTLDTAAGILILKVSGGKVTDDRGASLDDRPITLSESFNLVASTGPEQHERFIAGLKKTED